MFSSIFHNKEHAVVYKLDFNLMLNSKGLIDTFLPVQMAVSVSVHVCESVYSSMPVTQLSLRHKKRSVSRNIVSTLTWIHKQTHMLKIYFE